MMKSSLDWEDEHLGQHPWYLPRRILDLYLSADRDLPLLSEQLCSLWRVLVFGFHKIKVSFSQGYF